MQAVHQSSAAGAMPGTKAGAQALAAEQEYVTVTVANQTFGIVVTDVQDVLSPQRIVRIPLAPAAVAGSLNLRGRIVTAIDLRVCLGMPRCAEPSRSMSVVVERGNELYSLLVDGVGEVLRLNTGAIERLPSGLSGPWRELSDGVFRRDGQLLLSLSVRRLLDGLGAGR